MNVAELIAAATRKSKRQINKLLAERFPQPDLPTRVRAVPSRPAPSEQLVPEPVDLPPPPAEAEPPSKDERFPGFVTFLEFDHVLEVARGGRSAVDNLRLRCRAHNQYTAEQTYGADLMRGKIRQAQDERSSLSRATPV